MRRACGMVLALTALAAPAAAADWRPIFNGRDLTGWVPKINHHPLGENWRDTFRAEDGVLRVSYDRYDGFKDEFGHLIFRTPLSSYRLRLEYRFVGEQVAGAPAWAVRNSGVMLHGQAPETIGLDQPFPASVEAQLLAGAPGEARPTGNVCTPGVTVAVDGVRRAEHCLNATSKTYPVGEWVRFEAEVRGGRMIRHAINGETVLEYAEIRHAPHEYAQFGIPAAALPAGGAAPLERGYISLQAEGHPIEFRRIEVLELP